MKKDDLPEKIQRRIVEEFAHDPNVFEQVYEHYFELIMCYLAKRTMSSEVAYDLTAETFIKAFESFNRFKWQGISIKIWLFRIAINVLKNHRRMPTEEMLQGDEDQIADVRDELKEMDKRLFGDEDLSKLSDAIETLNPNYKNVVSLYFFSDMSQEDIGKSINRSTSAVKSMIHRAVSQLRQILSLNELQYENQ